MRVNIREGVEGLRPEGAKRQAKYPTSTVLKCNAGSRRSVSLPRPRPDRAMSQICEICGFKFGIWV